MVEDKTKVKPKRRKRKAGIRKVIDVEHNTDIPTWSLGLCYKCGLKGELANKLCVTCWDKTNDKAYTEQHYAWYKNKKNR